MIDVLPTVQPRNLIRKITQYYKVITLNAIELYVDNEWFMICIYKNSVLRIFTPD